MGVDADAIQMCGSVDSLWISALAMGAIVCVPVIGMYYEPYFGGFSDVPVQGKLLAKVWWSGGDAPGGCKLLVVHSYLLSGVL